MSEVNEKPDRRKQRTRKALREALIALISERGYEAISVGDIADRADINRATFYLHYRDKDDLLFRGMAELYDVIGAHDRQVTRQRIAEGDTTLMTDASDFEHVHEHADFYRELLSERGSIAFTIRMLDYLTDTFRSQVIEPLADGVEPEIPADFMAAFLAGAEIGLIRWWLTKGDAYSPEDMARMMYLFSVFGASWALRFGTESVTNSTAT